jgi:serine/threonine-protein kinase
MATIGNYRIIKRIGKGGFGTIFQAEHVLLGEKACLKQNNDATPEAAELLRKEAKLLWRLSEYHSIPSSKDLLKAGPDSYAMVMSYIDGKTLDEIVKDGRHLHPEDACWVAERLLGALHYCHYNGVIHSDVKPENIFIEPAKRDIKLIDFGLAACGPTSRTLPLGYTPRYAAPELQLGKPPVPETDIYGAGMVLLYSLGGNVELRSLPADTPPAIAEFCTRLIQYDPTQRPNWEQENIMQTLSDIRLKVFGRRHSA